MPATEPIFSWEAISSTKQWEDLTEQQRIWCIAWLSNGHDYFEATSLAYHGSANSRTMSYEIRKHPSVVAFLELYRVLTQGSPTKEEQIAGILASIRQAPPYEQSRMRHLLAKLTGVIEMPPETEVTPDLVEADTKFEVGATVEQDGHRYRIVAEEI